MKKYISVKELSGDLFPSRTENIFAAQNTHLTPAAAKCLEFAELHVIASQDAKTQRGVTNILSSVYNSGDEKFVVFSIIGEDPLSRILGRGNKGVSFLLSFPLSG